MNYELLNIAFSKMPSSPVNFDGNRWTLFDCIMYSEPTVEVIMGQVIRDSTSKIMSGEGCDLTEIYAPLESLLDDVDFLSQVQSFTTNQKIVLFKWLDALLEYDEKSGGWDKNDLNDVVARMKKIVCPE
jgi:hypothetical protein